MEISVKIFYVVHSSFTYDLLVWRWVRIFKRVCIIFNHLELYVVSEVGKNNLSSKINNFIQQVFKCIRS